MQFIRIRIALSAGLTLLVTLHGASALPSQINNSEPKQVAVQTSEKPVVTENPQPKPEQPQEAPQPVAVQSEEIPPSQPVTCGDNTYANYIYMHESSCNVNAVNSIGCRGIGQACPGSKLPCGSDYECQNKWFTNYALTRYGSWKNAYETWLIQHWW